MGGPVGGPVWGAGGGAGVAGMGPIGPIGRIDRVVVACGCSGVGVMKWSGVASRSVAQRKGLVMNGLLAGNPNIAHKRRYGMVPFWNE